MTDTQKIIQDLHAMGNPELAMHHMRFFKTGKGQYGEGDLFLGLKTPEMKDIAKKYKTLPLSGIQILIQNPYHEARSLALAILTLQYPKASLLEREKIVALYLNNTKYINNWDLVDISAYKIIGAYVYETKKTDILYDLAGSKHLWSERISVVGCLYLIKKNDFQGIQKLAVLFLNHPHDLMHKAVGWMLREMGKKDTGALLNFLDQYASQMPRTTLRYALEKFTPAEKKYYMTLTPLKKGEVNA